MNIQIRHGWSGELIMLSSSGFRLCCPCSWLRKLWQRDHNSMIRFVLGRNLFVIVFGLLNGSIGEYSGVPSPQMICRLLKSLISYPQFFGYEYINPLYSSPYLPEFIDKEFNVLCRGSCSTKTGLINSTGNIVFQYSRIMPVLYPQ